MLHFDSVKLSSLMKSQLKYIGVDPISTDHVVDCVIQTSLRGVDSHGINLFPHYYRAALAGRINVNPQIKIERAGRSVSIVDGDHGYGHHSGYVAIQEAIRLARENGIGAVGVKNSTHFSAAAYYGLCAAESDCLGFAFTNADALVKASGAKEAFFGTNPICFTAPLKSEPPLCLDMATSQVSWNKIMNYRRANEKIPMGWAFDSHGIGTVNPHDAVSLNPAGEYKGFGLGLMIDVLCATLLGGVQGKDLMPMYQLPLDGSKRGIGHFFMAIDISKFTNVDLFKIHLQAMADRIRGLAPVENDIRMIPGDPEKNTYLIRVESGIPIDDVKYAEFININGNFETAII